MGKKDDEHDEHDEHAEHDMNGGKKKHKMLGSRAQVWHGTAKKTSGGLMRKHLKKNKHGRIVSKKMSATAKKDKRLKDFKTKKGTFKLFTKKKNKKGRRR